MADQRAPWRVDFKDLGVLDSRNRKLDPPGWDSQLAKEALVGGGSSLRKRDPVLLSKKQEALMAQATGAARQVGFMCFMMWMMGNGIQIFSIIMTISGLATPIAAILKSKDMFPRDPEGKLDVITPRLLYCLIQLAQFVFALNKLNNMGLLPTHASDWMAGAGAPEAAEHAYGPLT